MLNDFTGGGQVFLHKVRMFWQVAHRSFSVALLVTMLLVAIISFKPFMELDLPAAMSYQKAILVSKLDDITRPIRVGTNSKSSNYYTPIDAYNSKGLYAKNVKPARILSSQFFSSAYSDLGWFLYSRLLLGLAIITLVLLMIFIFWARFGKSIKDDRKVKGGKILSAPEVGKILRKLGLASKFKIGDMPLVKDSENRHILISGATGSGKTNLIDTLLPQIQAKNQPAIIIDQTGEMIAKYYNSSRGDIIFNPLDARSHVWDFWGDCFSDNASTAEGNERLEKFAKILFGFNRKSSVSYSDPFWENSSEAVFIACAQHVFLKGDKSIPLLKNMLQNWSLGHLAKVLKNTPAARYLSSANKITSSSILSVMTTSTRPLNYLKSSHPSKMFSLNSYLKQVADGGNSWLFLSTKLGQRELTLPLIACLTELAVSQLVANGIQEKRKLWFVLDELAALGRLPALSGMMSEGRKYGACVIAAMQSLNQLYDNYGQYAGSMIFGQFGTKFFFRNDEPQIAKIITDLCGSEVINKQQKNTSFGASELRDGVSYTEQERSRVLVEYSDLASLDVGQCYVLLPEPKARLAKIHVPQSKQRAKQEGFVGRSASGNTDVTGGTDPDNDNDPQWQTTLDPEETATGEARLDGNQESKLSDHNPDHETDHYAINNKEPELSR